MTTAPLHNFALSFLQWGHRCRRLPEPAPAAEEEERETDEEERERTWNLRPRKSAAAKSARLRGISEGHVAERKNLWVSLSREEIEEDMYAMTGGKPNRRPRKRVKNVQKQLDGVFPGLYLVGITADAYRVYDATK